MKIKTLELFGGIGAPRKALELLGIPIKCIDYVEILPYAVTAYNNMFNNNYSAQNVIDWNLNVDILIHGSPCQDFSKAGKNDINNGRSILYNRTLEIIEKELNPRPKYIIWENVPGLLSKKHIKHFSHYLHTLERLGYYNHFKVLNSIHSGIPQSRNRVFVVSIRKDVVNDFNFENIKKINMQPLNYFLDENPSEEKLEVTQPSMIKSIIDNKTWIAITYVSTITTVLIRQNTSIVYKDFINYIVIPRKTDGKLISGNYNRIWKTDKYMGTITANHVNKVGNIEDEICKFRFLSRRERFRLMGFSDDDFEKLLLAGIPKTKLDLITGNSIVVQSLMQIFGELFKIPNYESKIKDSIIAICKHDFIEK